MEDDKKFMHIDHKESIVYDRYIVEFDYDPTCNYYERGNYGCRNFHDTKLPLFVLRLLLSLSSSFHMLVFACLDNLFLIKCLCIGSMLELSVFSVCFMMLSLCFYNYLSWGHHWNLKPILMAIKKDLVGRQPNE